MDAEITLEWMGEVLKALVRWFAPPKDMSGFPDAPPRFDLVGAGGIGVLGGGVDGTFFAPYIPLTIPVVPTVRPVVQPIYDTETIDAGGAGGYVHQYFATAVDYGNDLEFDTVTGNM